MNRRTSIKAALAALLGFLAVPFVGKARPLNGKLADWDYPFGRDRLSGGLTIIYGHKEGGKFVEEQSVFHKFVKQPTSICKSIATVKSDPSFRPQSKVDWVLPCDEE